MRLPKIVLAGTAALALSLSLGACSMSVNGSGSGDSGSPAAQSEQKDTQGADSKGSAKTDGDGSGLLPTAHLHGPAGRGVLRGVGDDVVDGRVQQVAVAAHMRQRPRHLRQVQADSGSAATRRPLLTDRLGGVVDGLGDIDVLQ